MSLILLNQTEEHKSGQIKNAVKKVFFSGVFLFIISALSFAAEPPGYDAGIQLAKDQIKQKDFKAAEETLEALLQKYPGNTELLTMLGRVLFWQDKYDESINAFTEALAVREDPSVRQELERVKETKERETALREYEEKRDQVRTIFGYYHYSSGADPERSATLEVSKKLGKMSFVLADSQVSRFGLDDNQLELTVYSKLGKKRWGYIRGAWTPDADFLPETAFSAEVYQGYKKVDFSIGYSRLNFDDPADIIMPGIIVYLPKNFFISEKLYYVPERGTGTLLSTLHYRPDRRFKSYVGFGYGRGSERVGALEDIEKIDTFSARMGAEYRFRPAWSAAGSVSYESREGLYDRTGATVSLTYWW